ncbi:MAG TPA: formimidoylglutamate deiminase [Burkholderiaceae bacterium]
MTATRYWAPAAWVDGGWQPSVVLEVDASGHWTRIEAGVPAPQDAERLAGPVLPGLVDAHSHAFQRAFAGLAERRDGDEDDFWSWRDRMYKVANAVTPESLRAIAAHLYVELLRGGYTQVCEFHYLQHQADGTPYDDPLALSMALADAAGDAGIGLTLLPVLYERAGFTAPALRPDQRRFHAGAADVWRRSREFERRVAAAGRASLVPLNAGLAIHSVRAAAAGSILELRRLAQEFDGPIHVHVAEQRAELRDCVAATGQTPVAWLASQGWLDARWQLVHATHVDADEIAATAASGAGVVICPGTEGNLGDGFTDVPAWLAADVDLAIGSDSNVTRSWREELRWMEYGQRLRLERRNVCAQPRGATNAAPGRGGTNAAPGREVRPQPDTAASLFERARAGGGRAAGHAAWGLAVGARADLLVADPDDASLLGLPRARWLDALVFSSPGRPWRDVMVAGRWALRGHHHAQVERIAAGFAQAMGQLWEDA